MLGPIARSFWANEEMGDLILDGVVCVVDCRNVLKVRLPLRPSVFHCKLRARSETVCSNSVRSRPIARKRMIVKSPSPLHSGIPADMLIQTDK